MDKHLDAIGYLLAALVFSVGFLSNRIHSRLDSTIRTVSDRSWRVRQALGEGRRLGPADLAEVLSIVHGSIDYVMVGSRVLNWSIFACIGVIFGDAIALRIGGTGAPGHEMAVLSLMFAASLSVVLFSEFDVRRVAIEQRREVAASTLGRIERLSLLMSRGDIPGAARALEPLRDTFTDWGLLTELDAYIDLLRTRPEAALEKIEALVASDGDLYLSPVIGTACCLQLDRGEAAMELITRMEDRGDDLPHLVRLRRALAVSAAHLPDLLAHPISEPVDSPSRRRAMGRLVGDLIGQELEMRHEMVRDLALDLNPAKVAQTAPLISTLSWWDGAGRLPEPATSGVLSALLDYLFSEQNKRPATDIFRPYARSCRDPITLETLGLVAFASGEPRTALGYFESAIRLQPAAARSHWGRAIACHKVGWLDAARTSLRRAVTLSDDMPLMSHTRRLFEQGHVRLSDSDIVNFYPAGLGAIDCFELALLGVGMPLPPDSSIGGKFATALIALALAHNAPEMAQAA